MENVDLSLATAAGHGLARKSAAVWRLPSVRPIAPIQVDGDDIQARRRWETR